MSHTYLESHRVKLDVEVEDEGLQPAVDRILPPGWVPSDDFPEDGHFIIGRGHNGGYTVVVDGAPVGTDLTPEVAVHVLDAQIRGRIALVAPDRVFVHAGVVAVGERALVLPAPSFSGKSALVAALATAGATYYSDEFAVLDAEGWVHPYARLLSLRGESARWGEYEHAETMGGRIGTIPARVGLIVVTRYVPGARWMPERREPGVGALALLSNTVATVSRPEATMKAVGRASAGAHVLEGDRGEAGETASILIDALATQGLSRD